MINIIRLSQQWLNDYSMDAYIVPSNDPHMSEYVADHFRTIAALTEFTGSAGTVLITRESVELWSDSRYFIQAEKQICSDVIFHKSGLKSTLSTEEWLKENLPTHAKVAVDGRLFTINAFNRIAEEIYPLKLVFTEDIFDNIWKDRPVLNQYPGYILDSEYCGVGVMSKCDALRKALSITDGKHYILTALDEIAWLLNIRGCDISYNPLCLAYGVLSADKFTLFISSDKFTKEDTLQMEAENIHITDYDSFDLFLSKLSGEVIINSEKLSIHHYSILKLAAVTLIEETDKSGAVASAKMTKNQTEISGFKEAMRLDGISLTRLYMWIEKCLYSSDRINEYDITLKIKEFRSLSPLYKGESFGTIAGYKENGAIVHYSPCKDLSKEIFADGFLLIDTGGQYLCGTTDITRTVHLSNPSKEEKLHYTLVLKGHISLARAVFPTDTRGSQLDILAKEHLLHHSLNYLHGTGHGVGHFLCVHETPISIRNTETAGIFKEGMITTNEPGVYIKEKYGIRTENIMLCTKHSDTEFGELLKFETLTMFPIDRTAIDRDIMTDDEIVWLNTYHENVFETLSAGLSADERIWLKEKCSKL